MKDIFITAPLLSLLSWKVLTCANTFDWHQMTSHHNLQRLASAICRIELKGRSHLHPENRTGDRTYPITNYPKMHISLRFKSLQLSREKRSFDLDWIPWGTVGCCLRLQYLITISSLMEHTHMHKPLHTGHAASDTSRILNLKRNNPFPFPSSTLGW